MPRNYTRKLSSKTTKSEPRAKLETEKSPDAAWPHVYNPLKVEKPRPKVRVKKTYRMAYFIQSLHVDRKVKDVGRCKKNIWVEVSEEIYKGFVYAIESGSGDIGWRVRKTRILLEV